MSTLSDLVEFHAVLKSLPRASRKERLADISAHIDAAVEFLEAATSTRQPYSFLPTYYGLLNLAKSAVLFGPLAAELTTQRHHGLSYQPFRSPKDLLSDRFRILKRGGAIPLLYRTLTNATLRPMWVKLDSVYRYIDGISFEYESLSGKPSALSSVELELEQVDSKFRIVARASSESPFASISTYRQPALSGLRRIPGEQFAWRSRLIAAPDDRDAIMQVRKMYKPFLLVHEPASNPYLKGKNTYAQMPWSNVAFYPVEEINILFAFFHMSSIVRYDPIFMKQLQESKAVPLLLALQRHGLYKYLVAFYSYALQNRVSITRN